MPVTAARMASMITPDPCASLCPDFTVMATTLGATAAAVAVQFGLVASAWTTGPVSAPRPRVDVFAVEEACEPSPSWTAA